jgi:hypothetical protein
MNTLDVIISLAAEHSEISEFTICQFEKQSDVMLEHKDWDNNANMMFDYALTLRKNIKLPFWEGIMLSTFDNPNLSLRCISSALRHNAQRNKQRLKSNELGILKQVINSNEYIAINSEVICKNGEVKFIPMLDFHIPVSDINLNVVIAIIANLGMDGGYILNSGNSYHFIGKTLITKDDQRDFLSKALLFSPVVDHVWIAHQIIEQSCALRLGIKHGINPTLIVEI